MRSVGPCEPAGLALSMGSGSGIMFSVAHDLLHSKDPMERFLASSLLCTAGYMHWTLSHLAHHVKVSYKRIRLEIQRV